MKRGRLEANPDQSEALTAIFRWKEKGYSLRKNSDKLGLQVGVQMSFMRVKELS